MFTVLLSTAGMTPAVITETLWALHRRDGAVPDGLVIVTTTEGRDRLTGRGRFTSSGGVLPFLGSGGQLEAFLRDYAPTIASVPVFEETTPLDAAIFTTGSPHIFPVKLVLIETVPHEPAAPRFLADIRDDASNAAALGTIVATVEELSRLPELRLHASLAGGRKTMSSSLENAMMLFGRPDDELSHVLVPEAAERDPTFYYPGPEDDRTIDLGLRPYLRLRHLLTEDPLVWRRATATDRAEGPRYDFTWIFRIASLIVSRPVLKLTDRTRSVTLTPEHPPDRLGDQPDVGPGAVTLSAQRYSFLRLLAERRTAAGTAGDAIVTADEFTDRTSLIPRRLIEIYGSLVGGDAVKIESLRKRVLPGPTEPDDPRSFFNQLCANLRDELRKGWGSVMLLEAFGPQKGRAEIWLPDRFSAIHFN
jgi:CRISPR-associated protein (TIGR02584 family)